MPKAHKISESDFVSDFVDDYGITQKEVSESILKKWVGDVTKRINIPAKWKDYVVLLPINNYKAELPDNMEVICEIAYTAELKEDDCKIVGYQVSQWKQSTCEEGCELEINLVCPACHETTCQCDSAGVTVDIDYIFEDAHPELYYKHYDHYRGVSRFGYGKSAAHPEFRLMSPTNSPWDKVRHLPNCSNIHCKQDSATYSIDDCILDTSIKKGWVLVSYMGPDPKCEKMIDVSNPDIVEAIMQFLKWKYFQREFIKTREASDKQLSAEGFQLYEEFLARYLSKEIIPPADELMRHFNSTKWHQIESAMCNFYEGQCPTPNLSTTNHFKTRRH